jgi:hypothetical protein
VFRVSRLIVPWRLGRRHVHSTEKQVRCMHSTRVEERRKTMGEKREVVIMAALAPERRLGWEGFHSRQKLRAAPFLIFFFEKNKQKRTQFESVP